MRELSAQIVVRRGDSFLLDIDLRIDPGQTVALLGPNGAGKSTVVWALSGLVELEGKFCSNLMRFFCVILYPSKN